MADIVIQIIARENGDVVVNGNCTDIAMLNLLIDKVKNQFITAKPKEPSLIQQVQTIS